MGDANAAKEELLRIRQMELAQLAVPLTSEEKNAVAAKATEQAALLEAQTVTAKAHALRAEIVEDTMKPPAIKLEQLRSVIRKQQIIDANNQALRASNPDGFKHLGFPVRRPT